jgi:hypothetical protein
MKKETIMMPVVTGIKIIKKVKKDKKWNDKLPKFDKVENKEQKICGLNNDENKNVVSRKIFTGKAARCGSFALNEELLED